MHWSNFTAKKIIQEKGEKDLYTIATGITPSGFVHFGNFREVVTGFFISESLKNIKKNVRFIFSWDDYDTFRKIPVQFEEKNLEPYLYQPITKVPDPFGQSTSYAHFFKQEFEKELDLVGVTIESISQSEMYQKKTYNKDILEVLEKKELLREILNRYRTEKLPEQWLPLNAYCSVCSKDKLTTLEYSNKKVHYICSCGNEVTENVLDSSSLKLPWRIDWPMRWRYEKVDFEAAGKDHSSQGGSFDTAKLISKEVFNYTPPTYLQYDFVSYKGLGGKMSSSKGNLVRLKDVLEIYSSEIIFWIFASYKPNVDFSICFDIDVIKTYENFNQFLDKTDDLFLEIKKLVHLSDQKKLPSFRHFCNLLQIHNKDQKIIQGFYDHDISDFFHRACFWLENYAPEDFLFQLKTVQNIKIDQDFEFFKKFSLLLSHSFESDTSLHEAIYALIHEYSLNPKDVFQKIYQLMIDKNHGPKLAHFILEIGQDKVKALIDQAL